jgi:hypothetical protein
VHHLLKQLAAAETVVACRFTIDTRADAGNRKQRDHNKAAPSQFHSP